MLTSDKGTKKEAIQNVAGQKRVIFFKTIFFNFLRRWPGVECAQRSAGEWIGMWQPWREESSGLFKIRGERNPVSGLFKILSNLLITG